jgi:NADH:ubiquinone oxidoreductase subunit B-like Fe-S oxidoreductase
MVEVGLGSDAPFFTSRLDDLVAWGRKYSFFLYPFITACAAWSSRVGAAPVRRSFRRASLFSPARRISRWWWDDQP